MFPRHFGLTTANKFLCEALRQKHNRGAMRCLDSTNGGGLSQLTSECALFPQAPSPTHWRWARSRRQQLEQFLIIRMLKQFGRERSRRRQRCFSFMVLAMTRLLTNFARSKSSVEARRWILSVHDTPRI